MSNKINIDELLRQELGNLSPEPPADAWQQVNSQVQASAQGAQASGQALNGAASAVKTVALGTKIIIASVALVASVAAIVGYQLFTEPGQKKQEQPVAIGQPAQAETNVPLKNESTTREASYTDLSQQPIPTPATTAPKPNRTPAQHDVQHEKNNTTYNPAQAVNSSSNPVAGTTVQNGSPENPLPAPETEQATTEPATRKQHDDNADDRTKEAIEESAENALNVPNVFTPNNDGANDQFVITIEDELLFDLKITDTKGNIVFETTDKNNHWNGVNMLTGKSCEAGTYVLAFRYQLKGMKSPRVKTGTIKLLQ